MNNYEILQNYSRTDLRRLAKGKISEIVGLDADKILRDLSRVLGNYESIKRNLEFRNPPADTILEVLLEAEGHKVRVDELKNRVRSRIQEHRAAAKSLPIHDSARGYHLYSVLLAEAWDHDGDLVPAEANLLRVLRHELGISRRDHQLIMAHPQVDLLKFDLSTFDEEIAFLTNEGIVLVCCEDGDGHFVLSDETAESILQLWGFEMEPRQYGRLLASLTKAQLVRVVRSTGLKTSGSASELADRILAAEIPPSQALHTLPGAELASLLGKLDLTRSGSKEERILRITDHFRSDADLAEDEVDGGIEIPPPELRVLTEELIADLLDEIGTVQLASMLEALELPKSGSKAVRIERLLESHYNTATILDALRLEEIRELAGKLGLKRSGSKGNLVDSIIEAQRTREIESSPLAARDLLGLYSEIAAQDSRAYPTEAQSAGLSVTRIGLDFERATRHIFKNLLNLDTRASRPGREEPDGMITDDDGHLFCYECKTVLSPPYTLPIAHRLQIRNYVSAIARSRRAEQFAGYLIIAHSFDDGIEAKIAEVEPELNAPIAALSAGDLLAFARKWQQEHSIDTYPLGATIKSGRLTMRDLDSAIL